MSTAVGKEPKIILLLIRSLNIGGAERQVVSLAKSISTLGTEVHVAVKAGGGPLEIDLASVPNVQLHHLGERGTVGQFKYFLKLRKLIKTNRYDAVYGFMPLPNLALLIAHTLRNRPLITWGVRSSGLDLSQYSSRVKWAMRLERWLARFADKIITNSQSALDEYRERGYPLLKLSHIPNAINTDRFKPDPEAKSSIRTEFNISDKTRLIGIFARIHPMKDHATLLLAAHDLIKLEPNVRFLCAGESSSEYAGYESKIRELSTKLELDEHVIWLGARTDPERLMAACDITTLTSDSGEGFPNSIAESMACGTLCVATDIGDSAAIISDSRLVVSPKRHDHLAKAWNSLLSLNQSKLDDLGESMRQSIIDRYSKSSITVLTLDALSR